MNRFYTTDNGGLPVTLNDLRFLMDSYTEAIKQTFYLYNQTTPSLLYGVDVTVTGGTATWTAGAIFANGEIFLIDGGTSGETGDAQDFKDNHYIYSAVTWDPTGNKLFKDSTSHDTYQVRKAYIGTTDPCGWGSISDWALFKDIHNIWDGYTGTYASQSSLDATNVQVAYNHGLITGLTTNVLTKYIEIGAWNMSGVTSVAIPHATANVIDVSVTIKDDALTGYRLLNDTNNVTCTPQGGWRWDGTNVTLSRLNSGNFDSASYGNAVMNRGYILITYRTS
jgi:hypothetical protein